MYQQTQAKSCFNKAYLHFVYIQQMKEGTGQEESKRFAMLIYLTPGTVCTDQGYQNKELKRVASFNFF
jgi:hypothetical protein